MALLIITVLVVTTIVVHYEALRLISAFVAQSEWPLRLRVLCVVLGCFAAHAVEITIYAIGYYLIEAAGFGSLSGSLEGGFADYLYFSATAFSTLGFGDINPHGVMRLVSGFEGVNGLFLIAWSTSFTYLAMERLWALHSRIGAESER